MLEPFDSTLIIGFGGPTRPGEARAFVRGIVGETPDAEERIEEVTVHYERFGGVSPYNELTFRQADALAAELARRGGPADVYVGMINWEPRLKDTLARMAEDGRKRTAALVMSVFQSKVSWEKYIDAAESAKSAIGKDAPELVFLEPLWRSRPGFIQTQASLIRGAAETIGSLDDPGCALIFSAHSIPEIAARRSPYVRQYEETAAAVSQALGGKEYATAYQSGPTNPSIPWMGPDINEAVAQAKERGAWGATVACIGFLVDHIEVLYDLDVAARGAAARCGLKFALAPTVGDRPEFIGELASQILGERSQ